MGWTIPEPFGSDCNQNQKWKLKLELTQQSLGPGVWTSWTHRNMAAPLQHTLVFTKEDYFPAQLGASVWIGMKWVRITWEPVGIQLP